MCDVFVNILRSITEEQELGPRPGPDFFMPCFEKLPCCGGQLYECSQCHKTFSREHKLYEHMREVHNKANRVACSCGEIVLKRNMKRHNNFSEPEDYKIYDST